MDDGLFLFASISRVRFGSGGGLEIHISEGTERFFFRNNKVDNGERTSGPRYAASSYLVLCVGYIIIPCISLYCIWFVQESILTTTKNGFSRV